MRQVIGLCCSWCLGLGHFSIQELCYILIIATLVWHAQPRAQPLRSTYHVLKAYFQQELTHSADYWFSFVLYIGVPLWNSDALRHASCAIFSSHALLIAAQPRASPLSLWSLSSFHVFLAFDVIFVFHLWFPFISFMFHSSSFILLYPIATYHIRTLVAYKKPLYFSQNNKQFPRLQPSISSKLSVASLSFQLRAFQV